MKLLDIIRRKTRSVAGHRIDTMNNAGNILRLLSGRKRQSIPKVRLLGADRILKVGAIPGKTMLQQSGEGYSMTGSREAEEIFISRLPDAIHASFTPMVVTDKDGNEHYFYEKETPPVSGQSPSRKLFHLERYANGTFAPKANELAERWRGAGGTQHSMYPHAACCTDNDGNTILHLVYVAHCHDIGEPQDGRDQENTMVMYTRRINNNDWMEPHIRLSGDWSASGDWGFGNERRADGFGRMTPCIRRPPVYHCMDLRVEVSDSGLVVVAWSQHPRFQPCGEYHNIFVRIHEGYGAGAADWRTDFWKDNTGRQIGRNLDVGDFARVTALERTYQPNMRGVTHWCPHSWIDNNDNIHLLFSRKRLWDPRPDEPNFEVQVHYLICRKNAYNEWFWDFVTPDQPPLEHEHPAPWVSETLVSTDLVLDEQTIALSVLSISGQSFCMLYCFYINAEDQYWHCAIKGEYGWVSSGPLMFAGGRSSYPVPAVACTKIEDHFHIFFVYYVDILKSFFFRYYKLSWHPYWYPPLDEMPITLLTIPQDYSSNIYSCRYDSVKHTLITAFGKNSDPYHQIFACILENPESLPFPPPLQETKVVLEMPISIYRYQDIFYLSLYIESDREETITARLYILLEINGQIYFWPSWSEHEDFRVVTVQPGRKLEIIIDRFWWPLKTGSGTASFIAALISDDGLEIIGEPDEVYFSWEPESS